ncbi:MAG: hypothetical protein HYS07_02235 [Chlamydiae bacterium]|nr:hypothetical protein [Chlamydiota bacterium]MBI3276733.1 hypothetical protein [Chlamydiota bacterium]
MLNKLSIREKKLALFAGLIIVLMALYFMVLDPLFSKLRTLRGEIQKQSLIYAKYVKIFNSKDHIEHTYNQYVGIVKVEGSSQEEISRFLAEIEALSRKSDVRVVDMKPLSTQDNHSIKKVYLEIEFEAQQMGLGKFLFELKNSQAMIHVDSLKVNAGARSEGLKCHLVLSRIVV